MQSHLTQHLEMLHYYWKLPNLLGVFRLFFSAGMLGSKNCCNCEILHQEVQKERKKKNSDLLTNAFSSVCYITSPTGETGVADGENQNKWPDRRA